ncbi:MAG: hypothetical protein ACF8PG_17995 [Maioricimonas sp. JB045]
MLRVCERFGLREEEFFDLPLSQQLRLLAYCRVRQLEEQPPA